jgi:hypothetical protein
VEKSDPMEIIVGEYIRTFPEFLRVNVSTLMLSVFKRASAIMLFLSRGIYVQLSFPWMIDHI